MNRAEAFYSEVKPFFEKLGSYVLIDCCAGDGKVGVYFDEEPNIEKIMFVDIKEPNKFKLNTSQLKTPFKSSLRGIENLVLPGNAAVIALHACGILTDKIIEKAVLSLAPLAVMPCCYNQNMKKYNLKNLPDRRKISYPSEKDYYDAFRARYLLERGYAVTIRTIDRKITPMNNIIIGIPN